MNAVLKHSILVLFSVCLVSATLFVPVRVYDEAGLSHVSFGFPIPFVTQDFSKAGGAGIGFFSYYQRISWEVTDILDGVIWQNSILSLLSVFLVVELLIMLLEQVKAAVLRRRVAPIRVEDSI